MSATPPGTLAQCTRRWCQSLYSLPISRCGTRGHPSDFARGGSRGVHAVVQPGDVLRRLRVPPGGSATARRPPATPSSCRSRTRPPPASARPAGSRPSASGSTPRPGASAAGSSARSLVRRVPVPGRPRRDVRRPQANTAPTTARPGAAPIAGRVPPRERDTSGATWAAGAMMAWLWPTGVDGRVVAPSSRTALTGQHAGRGDRSSLAAGHEHPVAGSELVVGRHVPEPDDVRIPNRKDSVGFPLHRPGHPHVDQVPA